MSKIAKENANRLYFFREAGWHSEYIGVRFDVTKNTTNNPCYIVVDCSHHNAANRPPIHQLVPDETKDEMALPAGLGDVPKEEQYPYTLEMNLLIGAYNEFCAESQKQQLHTDMLMRKLCQLGETSGPGSVRPAISDMRQTVKSLNDQKKWITDPAAVNHLSSDRCLTILQQREAELFTPHDYEKESHKAAKTRFLCQDETYARMHDQTKGFEELDELEMEAEINATIKNDGQPTEKDKLQMIAELLGTTLATDDPDPVDTKPDPNLELGDDTKICIPGTHEQFVATNDMKSCFKLMDKYDPKSNGGAPLFLLVVGPTGCGKTSSAKVKAHKDQRHFLVVDCAAAQEPTDLFGGMTAKDGSTDFVLSDLTKAVQIPKCLIVLDEVNRATHEVRNSLLALLDGRGETTLPGIVDGNGKAVHINVRPDVCFMATANIGANYSGTNKLDAAFRNRAKATLRVDYLSKLEEAKLLISRGKVNTNDAKIIAQLCHWSREESNKPAGGAITDPVATRTALHVADMVRCGLSLKEAVQIGVINNYDEAEDRTVVKKQFEVICNEISA